MEAIHRRIHHIEQGPRHRYVFSLAENTSLIVSPFQAGRKRRSCSTSSIRPPPRSAHAATPPSSPHRRRSSASGTTPRRPPRTSPPPSACARRSRTSTACASGRRAPARSCSAHTSTVAVSSAGRTPASVHASRRSCMRKTVLVVS